MATIFIKHSLIYGSAVTHAPGNRKKQDSQGFPMNFALHFGLTPIKLSAPFETRRHRRNNRPRQLPRAFQFRTGIAFICTSGGIEGVARFMDILCLGLCVCCCAPSKAERHRLSTFGSAVIVSCGGAVPMAGYFWSDQRMERWREVLQFF